MKTKAIFLLAIFLVNTLVGIACSLSMGSFFVKDCRCCHRKPSAYSFTAKQDHKSTVTLPADQQHSCPALVSNMNTALKIVPGLQKLKVLIPLALHGSYSSWNLLPLLNACSTSTATFSVLKWPAGKRIRVGIQSFQI